jgi:acyl dehydratase
MNGARYPERYFDEWNLGDRFVTGSAAITREEALEFAQRYDPQPFHLDDAAGAASVFGGLAASGWMTGAVTMRLIVDSGVMRGPGILGAGIDDLRWLAPVYPGDVLRVEGEVIGLSPNPNGKRLGRMRVRLVTINQDGTPVMTQIANLSAVMRPATRFDQLTALA